MDQHFELWAFAQDPCVVDSSKLNFKWSAGGDAVRWHQDIQAWPHTSFSVLTFGVYLEDTGTGRLVRGQEPLYVHMEPYPARLPPRWDQVGYCSIFAAQAPAYAD